MDALIDIKMDEGFKGEVYKCTEGYDTIGYGTRLPLNKEEATLLLEHRLNKMYKQLEYALGFSVTPEVEQILKNMVYQLGVQGVLGFKKMLKAIENKDYPTAGIEGRDSRWYSQTPQRAERLMKRLEVL